MNRIKSLITIGAFSLLVLGIPAIASAQYSSNDRYGNGGYNNGQYGNKQYRDSRVILRDLKNRSRQLEKQIDNELDRSRYNGTDREERVNDLAKDFRKAVNKLDKDYNDRNESEVRRVLETARQLDRAISRARFSYAVTNQWTAISQDLHRLGLGWGYTNRSNNRTSGIPSRANGDIVPKWWPF